MVLSMESLNVADVHREQRSRLQELTWDGQARGVRRNCVGMLHGSLALRRTSLHHSRVHLALREVTNEVLRLRERSPLFLRSLPKSSTCIDASTTSVELSSVSLPVGSPQVCQGPPSVVNDLVRTHEQVVQVHVHFHLGFSLVCMPDLALPVCFPDVLLEISFIDGVYDL
jgi:hypothetical protein